MATIEQLGETTPILGVCLGHQAIGAVFGGSVVRAAMPMHGKTSTIEHDGRGVFAGIDGPFVASRYHSLVVAEEGLPADLIVSARTREDRTIMGLRHRTMARARRAVSSRVDSDRPKGSSILRNFVEDATCCQLAPCESCFQSSSKNSARREDLTRRRSRRRRWRR